MAADGPAAPKLRLSGLPNPQLSGASPKANSHGRQPISQGVLTEAACVPWKGRPGADFASQRIGSGTARPPRLPLGLPQARSRSHRLAEHEDATGRRVLQQHSCQLTSISTRAWADKGNSWS